MQVWYLENLVDRDYDHNIAMVVLAPDEQTARELAQAAISDEHKHHPDLWLNPAYSSCEPEPLTGESRIILIQTLDG